MTIYRVPPMGPGPGNNDFGVRWETAPATWKLNDPGTYFEEPIRDTEALAKFVRYEKNATLSGLVLMPHTWGLDTEIRWHIRVLPTAPTGGNAYWGYRCRIAVRNGDAVPAAASWDGGNATTVVGGDRQYKHTLLPLLSIIPSGCTPGSALFFELTRLSEDMLDTYDGPKPYGVATANLGIIGVGVSFMKSSPGTPTELV